MDKDTKRIFLDIFLFAICVLLLIIYLNRKYSIPLWD